MAERTGSRLQATSQADAKRARAAAQRQISIKDIARLAHVSHPTVSRALRNSPLVSAETAARIRRIALEQGYRASAVARGLVTRETRTIGLIAMLDDPAAAEVACGVEEAANDLGYAAILINAQDNSERAHRAFKELAERRVDGIILTSPHAAERYLPEMKALEVPIVLANDHRPGEPIHSVSVANQEGMRAATQYLIGLGHRRVAYLGDHSGYRVDAARLAGYKAALARSGNSLSPELMVACEGGLESATEAMHELLRLDRPPTAVCCYNDMAALGAMRAIRARRLRVPDDISVTGFDDLFFAAYLAAPLTTVRQPLRQMGQVAMEIVVKLIAGENAPAQTMLDAELVIRGSAAKPPNRDKEGERSVL